MEKNISRKPLSRSCPSSKPCWARTSWTNGSRGSAGAGFQRALGSGSCNGANSASRYDQIRVAAIKTYTCPADNEAGVYDVLSSLNRPMGSCYTNSYAACYGAGGVITSQPDNSWFQRKL